MPPRGAGRRVCKSPFALRNRHSQKKEREKRDKREKPVFAFTRPVFREKKEREKRDKRGKPRIFLFAAPKRIACAAFSTESRMKFVDPAQPYRKIRVVLFLPCPMWVAAKIRFRCLYRYGLTGKRLSLENFIRLKPYKGLLHGAISRRPLRSQPHAGHLPR